LTIDEDGEGTLTPDCTDPEGDPFTLEIAGHPLKGSASVPVAGTLRYVGSPNANGPDSFTYRARDAELAGAPATVAVTIRSVNDAPVCAAVSLTTFEDVAAERDPACTDIDGESLTYSIASSASQGTASVVNSRLRYAPNANANGLDSFTYQAADGAAESNAAAVNITVNAVNDAPVARDVSASTPEDTPKAVSLNASDVDGDSLTFTVVSAPAHGVLAGTGASRTYTPDENYHGSDSFTYRAGDGVTDSNLATVSLTVISVNDAPVARDLSASTPEDTPKQLTLNASDVDGDGLTFTIVSGPSNGVLSGSGANRTYTPNANYNGPDSFTYRASDGAADSNLATVSLTVESVNDAPSCESLPLTIDEDGSGTVTPVCTDPDGDAVSVAIVNQPLKGGASVVAGDLRYTPTPNANGSDSFTYRGSDGQHVGAPATVSVTIRNAALWLQRASPAARSARRRGS
jgi:hypothetical protein